MKIPCVDRLPFIVVGLSFLQAELTPIQFNNLTMIATALVLGSKFNLTEISRMWLSEKCVSTLSHFMSDAKFSTSEMQNLYILNALKVYKIRGGNFIIDDTMKHHTNFCKWIHGVSILFDHALKTNLKACCVVVLYYNDGATMKFPIDFRIYYQEKSKSNKISPWLLRKRFVYKSKYELAVEMIERAMKNGFPACVVLADSWFGIGPFVKELRRLKLSYVLEIKSNYKIREPLKTPRLTPTGKLAKKQYELIEISQCFKGVQSIIKCGFAPDKGKGKKAKVLYNVKTAIVKMNSMPGKHRVIESIDPAKQTVKYLLTNEFSWEASKIINIYSFRWVVEEFFRNAKQLSDMEGVTIRSEQGVTLSLCLVFWIDFLLHFENFKQSDSGKLQKDSLTIQSIIRRAQRENMEAFIEKIQNGDEYVKKWRKAMDKNLEKKRKVGKKLITFESEKEADDTRMDMAA